MQLLRQEAATSDYFLSTRNGCNWSSVLLLCCCDTVSALCVGVDAALGGHDSGLDYGYALGSNSDCLDDEDTAVFQQGGDYSVGQGHGGQRQSCRSLFKAAGLCPLLIAALEIVCDGRDRGDIVYTPSSKRSGRGAYRIAARMVQVPLASLAAALCRAVGCLALANESPSNNNSSNNNNIALTMLLGKSFFSHLVCVRQTFLIKTHTTQTY